MSCGEEAEETAAGIQKGSCEGWLDGIWVMGGDGGEFDALRVRMVEEWSRGALATRAEEQVFIRPLDMLSRGQLFSLSIYCWFIDGGKTFYVL